MPADPAAVADFTEDAFLAGRLLLRQPRRGHRAGHDAILLAAAVRARVGARVVEFGAGAGAAGLVLAWRVRGIDLTLIDINPVLVDLAQANAAANNIVARAVVLDLGAPPAQFAEAGLPPDCADHVLMNPPFHAAQRHRASPDAARRTAHLDEGEVLDAWVGAARRVLKSGGTLTLIWRADELDRVLAALRRGFGGIEIVPVYPKPEGAAIRILVRAVKGSRAPLHLCAGLVLNDVAGNASDEARSILEGAALGSGADETPRDVPEK